MRDHYDFSKMKGRKNPYVRYLKQPVTMRLDRDTVAYFKSIAGEMGIPYQSLSICTFVIVPSLGFILPITTRPSTAEPLT